MVEGADAELAVTRISGDIDGLTVLDSQKSPLFYKGRWVHPSKVDGRFVARREQRYGADLWSYVQLERGRPVGLLDFAPGEWRGCDQAWHLQMAIDALLEKPQRYRVEQADTREMLILTFFSPLPAWARRRLDILGTAITPKHGLLAYELPTAELEEERRFLETRLWLSAETGGQSG